MKTKAKVKAKGLPFLLIMAICILLVQVVAAQPPTPFLISGWVKDGGGNPVNNPIVNINNTNTSGQWLSEAYADHNYYQLILSTTNVSEGNVLEFNTTDGTRYNTTNHTVTQENISDGGIFNFNITLEAAVATTGDIIINEIMYDPAGNEYWYEWVELYNNDTVPINITGWTLDDRTISEKIMQLGDYILLSENKTAFESRYGTLPCSIIEVGQLSFSNGGDTIVLKNATGAEIDNVTYEAIAAENYTLELNATSGWEEGRVEGGTPCQLNSVLVGPPNITFYSPETPVYDIEGAKRTFSITIDQTVDVNWYLNGTYLFTNVSVIKANYTNTSAIIGTWNVSAIVSNPNGTAMHTWLWEVIEVLVPPTADSLSIEDTRGSSGTYVEVPVSITNVMNSPIQSIRLRVDYTDSVLNLMTIGNGNLTSAWTDLQLGVDGHTMVIATAHSEEAIPIGSSGSVVLLNFSVIGPPGDTSPMNMTLIELSNPEGTGVGTAPAKNGAFRVSELAAIVGRITYACNGTGIAGVNVNLTKEGAVVNTTVTNETGYYNFMDVTPDSYFVNASKPRFWDNSTEVTVIAGETTTADMTLWLKGDLNNNCEITDAGDVVLMLKASVGDISGDMRYDLNGNGNIADAGDVVLMLRASVGDIELL